MYSYSDEWIRDLVNALNSKLSNVGIVVTDDLIRISQLMSYDYSRVEAPNIDLSTFYLIDLQRSLPTNIKVFEIKREKGNIERVSVQVPQRSLTELVFDLLNRGNVIISYVYNQRDADSLANLIFAVHSAPDLYASRNNRHVLIVIADYFYWKFDDIPSVHPRPTIDDYKKLIEAGKTALMKQGYVIKNDISVEWLKGLSLWEAQGAIVYSKKFVSEKEVVFDNGMISKFKKEYFKKKKISIIESDIDFSKVGGMEKQKEIVRKYVVPYFRDPERARKYGITRVKGILLYGPPGLGKSWFAKAIAGEVNVPMLSVNASDFFGSLVGESEKKTVELFEKAELTGAIIFIDEIDQLGSKTARRDINQVNRNVANIILSLWQDLDVTIIGTTNFLEDLDDAFIRRFDFVLPVSYPAEEDRKEIFKVHIEKYNRVDKEFLGEIDYDKLAKESECLKPSEIEQAIKFAKYDAFAEGGKLTTEHIMRYIEKMKKEKVNDARREECKQFSDADKGISISEFESRF